MNPQNKSLSRPKCLNPHDIKTVNQLKSARWLLAQAWKRLRSGRLLEASRGIIYPEVGVSARDVERLLKTVAELEKLEKHRMNKK